jgi:hypothetical protein
LKWAEPGNRDYYIKDVNVKFDLKSLCKNFDLVNTFVHRIEIRQEKTSDQARNHSKVFLEDKI